MIDFFVRHHVLFTMIYISQLFFFNKVTQILFLLQQAPVKKGKGKAKGGHKEPGSATGFPTEV